MAPPLEAKTICVTPQARAAWARRIVPITFTSASKTGSSTDLRTSICAAWWRIVSTFSAPRRASKSNVRRSPSTNRAFAGTRSRTPVERSSRIVTRDPAARKASARCEPMNPAPPVTRTERVSGIMAPRIAMGEPKPLPGSFYRKATAEVARALLGCRLTRRLPDGTTRSVILVETEAYLGVKDRAAHTWNGRRTARVAPMWGEGGHAYVYFVYGMHYCLNVVTQGEGVPEAVLLRAGIPEEEEKISLKSEEGRGRRSGPAPKLCAISDRHGAVGVSLSGPELDPVARAARAFRRRLGTSGRSGLRRRRRRVAAALRGRGVPGGHETEGALRAATSTLTVRFRPARLAS